MRPVAVGDPREPSAESVGARRHERRPLVGKVRGEPFDLRFRPALHEERNRRRERASVRIVRVARAMRGARARESAPSPSPALGPCKPLHAQAKHFQICAPFLQIFPKIPSFILWKNKDLRAGQRNFRFPPNFCAPRPSKAPAPPARRRGGEHLEKNSTTFSFSEGQCWGLGMLARSWLAGPAFSSTGSSMRGAAGRIGSRPIRYGCRLPVTRLGGYLSQG